MKEIKIGAISGLIAGTIGGFSGVFLVALIAGIDQLVQGDPLSEAIGVFILFGMFGFFYAILISPLGGAIGGIFLKLMNVTSKHPLIGAIFGVFVTLLFMALISDEPIQAWITDQLILELFIVPSCFGGMIAGLLFGKISDRLPHIKSGGE